MTVDHGRWLRGRVPSGVIERIMIMSYMAGLSIFQTLLGFVQLDFTILPSRRGKPFAFWHSRPQDL
jgi:hypothetical protein